MERDDPRSTLERALALAQVVAVLLARSLVLSSIGLFQALFVERRPGSALLVVVVFASMLVAFAAVRFLRDRLRGHTRRATIGAALVLTALAAGHYAVLSRSVYAWTFANPREVGRFPFDPGTVIEEARGGRPTRAHIGEDGTRRCDSAPAPGAFVVALAGDSFVFGSGLNDDETLCWQLKEQLEAVDPRPWHVVNLGQPGAAMHSTLATARFAIEGHHADAVVMSVLPIDDLRAIDLNDHAWLVGRPWFRAVGALLHPESVFMVLNVGFEMAPPQGYGGAAFRAEAARARRLSDDTGVPLIVYLAHGPGPANPLVPWYDRTLQDLAGGDFLPLRPFFPRDEPPGVMYIAGDGHPTAANNAHTAAKLVEQLMALRPETP